MMWYGAGWMGLFGPLMMVVFWGGVILLAVWAVRAFSGPRSGSHDDAVDILKRRLASGEIDQDQYERARKALQG